MNAIRAVDGDRPLPSLPPLGELRRDPRQAIRDDAIICLICGRPFRQLTNTHLHGHGTTAIGYKARFGYNRRRPLMALSLRQKYAARAVATGLAARIRRRPILAEPELRRRGGARPIALEEFLTRREAQLRAREARRGRAGGDGAPPAMIAL
jgi:ROS/MUCR transcriptional regulator protein